jgi:two-component system, cell cycle sensor histidine kinase and response regulator CckA
VPSSPERHLDVILAHLAEGIVIFDKKGIIEYANPSFCHGNHSSVASLKGQSLNSVQALTSTISLSEVFSTIDLHGSWRGEWSRREADGRETKEQGSIYLLPSEKEKSPRYVLISHDITQKRETEEHTHHAQKMEAVGQLASGIAHDYNNLIGVILVHSELILNKLSPTDPLRNKVESIRRASQRAAQITKQLLALSRRQVFKPHLIDLHAQLDEMAEMVRRLAGEQIDTVTVLPSCEAKVKADETSLSQSIMNFILYSGESGIKGRSISLQLEQMEVNPAKAAEHGDLQTGSYVRLLVRSCMSAAASPEKPDLHFYIPGETQTYWNHPSLLTTYEMIQQNGGFIELSTPSSKIQVLSICLPQIPSAETHRNYISPAIPRGSETILLVEDDQTVVGILHDLLKDQGYQVVATTNGGEAIRICESGQKIDLLFTDIIMPGISGIDLAARVQELSPNTKILLTSGYMDRSKIVFGKLNPSFNFIAKPYDLATIAHKLRDFSTANRSSTNAVRHAARPRYFGFFHPRSES